MHSSTVVCALIGCLEPISVAEAVELVRAEHKRRNHTAFVELCYERLMAMILDCGDDIVHDPKNGTIRLSPQLISPD